jgi:hypothetical protein
MGMYILVHGIRVAKDFTPETFGRLTTIGPAFRLPIGNKYRSAVFQVCSCSCGGCVVARVDHLRSSATASCGCLALESIQKLRRTHGQSECAEYKIWTSMRARCHNSTSQSYSRYGGRGIKICKRWSEEDGFVNFLEDMGNRPSGSHSIDRIDVNGDYCPENCRWATSKEQANNRRSNKTLEYQGETKNLCEWAAIFAMDWSTLLARLNRGWSIDKALTTPIRPIKRTTKQQGNCG